MTRTELIQKLSLSFSFSQFPLKDIDLTAQVILDKLSHILAQGGRVEIRGFGSFALNHRPPRKGPTRRPAPPS